MYLSLFMITWGIYIAWNFVFTVPVPILLSIVLFSLAKEEEKFLIRSMSDSYREYQKSVKWMFIPGIL